MTRKLFILVFLLFASMANLVSLASYVFAQVDTAWTRRYDGTTDGPDGAHAIALDGSGNIYVAGSTASSGTQGDYCTIKYYPNGDTFWVRTYDGAPGMDNEKALAIEVDEFGNVYVTGYSGRTSEGLYYWTTIKYYSYGDTAWVRRYSLGGGYDQVWDIAVDGSGNVYVTGESYGGTETQYDYATIKYYPNGDTAWVRRYNGTANWFDAAYGLAVDDSGNVYVTGSVGDTSGSINYCTIKYRSNGDTAWVRRYNGAANHYDNASAIAVDGYDNVYVTGWSQVVGTYDEYDYATIKYYPNGDTAWVRRYDGPVGNGDFAYEIALDPSGNVFVTGTSGGSSTYDYATVKYYPNGNTAWVRRYNGSGDGGDWPTAIVTDASGNVYVTGYSRGSGTSEDYATVKYYPDGDTAWVRTYNGPENNIDVARAIAVDDSGNVYVTGASQDIGGNSDYFTIKYVQLMCGDVNGDKVIDIGDVVYLINYLYKEGTPPDPPSVGDTNCDGIIDVGDVVHLVNYLFKGGPAPCR